MSEKKERCAGDRCPVCVKGTLLLSGDQSDAIRLKCSRADCFMRYTKFRAGEPAAAAPPLATTDVAKLEYEQEESRVAKMKPEISTAFLAKSKSEYKRLVAQGAKVEPPEHLSEKEAALLSKTHAPRTPSGNTCTQNGDEGDIDGFSRANKYLTKWMGRNVERYFDSSRDKMIAIDFAAAYDQHRNRKLREEFLAYQSRYPAKCSVCGSDTIAAEEATALRSRLATAVELLEPAYHLLANGWTSKAVSDRIAEFLEKEGKG